MRKNIMLQRVIIRFGWRIKMGKSIKHIPIKVIPTIS